MVCCGGGRNHSVYDPTQWETALQHNAVSHWLDAHRMIPVLDMTAYEVFYGWYSFQWRHNGRDSVWNHQPHDSLLNRLFRRRSKKTSKLRVTGLCAGNSPGTGEFPAQMARYAENVSIWWRHHELDIKSKGPTWWSLGSWGPVRQESVHGSTHKRHRCGIWPVT